MRAEGQPVQRARTLDYRVIGFYPEERQTYDGIWEAITPVGAVRKVLENVSPDIEVVAVLTPSGGLIMNMSDFDDCFNNPIQELT